MKKTYILAAISVLTLTSCMNRGPHVNDPLGESHYYTGRTCCMITNDLLDEERPLTLARIVDCGVDPYKSKYHSYEFQILYYGLGYTNSFKYSIIGNTSRFKLEVTMELFSTSLDVLESYYSFMTKYVRAPKYSSIAEIIKDENDVVGPDSPIKKYSVFDKNQNLISYTEDPSNKVVKLEYEDNFDMRKFELNSGSNDTCVNWKEDWMDKE